MDPQDRKFCCLPYGDWEFVAGVIITIAFIGVIGFGSYLLGNSLFDLQLSAERKDLFIGFIVGLIFLVNIVYIAKRVCRYVATRKNHDGWWILLTFMFSISGYCTFLPMVFYENHQLSDETRSTLGYIAIASAVLAILALVIHYLDRVGNEDGNQNENQYENQRGGTIRTIARSFRRQNRVDRIPEEPSTSSSEINYEHRPPWEARVSSERESTGRPRNPNPPRLIEEAEVHRGPSTSRASEMRELTPLPDRYSRRGPPQQAQASSSVETDVERQRIRRSPTPFPHETTTAEESEPIMTRSRTQQQIQSTSRQRSQEIQLLPGQLEEPSGIESRELRRRERRQLEATETDRRLRPRATKKTS